MKGYTENTQFVTKHLQWSLRYPVHSSTRILSQESTGMLTEVGQIRKIVIKSGLHWWLRGTESARQCRRCGFDPWVRKIPWRRKWQPTPVFFPGKSQEYRSLAGYISWVTKSQMPLRNWTTIIKSILSAEVRVCCNVSKKHLRLWNHIEMIVNLCSSLTSIFSTGKISKCWHLHTHLFNNLSLAPNPFLICYPPSKFSLAINIQWTANMGEISKSFWTPTT